MEEREEFEQWTSGWIFAYGSLMWDPPFDYEAKQKCVLKGFRREMCMFSFSARGTEESPGLVLGLLEGENESCEGIAFRVDKERREDIFKAMQVNQIQLFLQSQQRENTPLRCYTASIKVVEWEMEGKLHQEDSLVFLPIRNHQQYAGDVSYDKKVEIISTSRGNRGTSFEYLRLTVLAIEECGFKDKKLSLLLEEVTKLLVNKQSD